MKKRENNFSPQQSSCSGGAKIKPLRHGMEILMGIHLSAKTDTVKREDYQGGNRDNLEALRVAVEIKVIIEGLTGPNQEKDNCRNEQVMEVYVANPVKIKIDLHSFLHNRIFHLLKKPRHYLLADRPGRCSASSRSCLQIQPTEPVPLSSQLS